MAPMLHSGPRASAQDAAHEGSGCLDVCVRHTEPGADAASPGGCSPRAPDCSRPQATDGPLACCPEACAEDRLETLQELVTIQEAHLSQQGVRCANSALLWRWCRPPGTSGRPPTLHLLAACLPVCGASGAASLRHAGLVTEQGRRACDAPRARARGFRARARQGADALLARWRGEVLRLLLAAKRHELELQLARHAAAGAIAALQRRLDERQRAHAAELAARDAAAAEALSSARAAAAAELAAAQDAAEGAAAELRGRLARAEDAADAARRREAAATDAAGAALDEACRMRDELGRALERGGAAEAEAGRLRAELAAAAAHAARAREGAAAAAAAAAGLEAELTEARAARARDAEQAAAREGTALEAARAGVEGTRAAEASAAAARADALAAREATAASDRRAPLRRLQPSCARLPPWAPLTAGQRAQAGNFCHGAHWTAAFCALDCWVPTRAAPNHAVPEQAAAPQDGGGRWRRGRGRGGRARRGGRGGARRGCGRGGRGGRRGGPPGAAVGAGAAVRRPPPAARLQVGARQ